MIDINLPMSGGKKEILDALFQLTEQLKYTLSNINESNLSESFNTTISQKVSAGGIVSAINQSAELIHIAANRIALEGYVTINGSFSIDKDGFLRCTGGTLGAFSVDNSGGLFGNGTLRVGNMTLDDTKITGLKVDTANLNYRNFNSDAKVYKLGVTPNGELVLFDETIVGSGLVKSTPGSAPPAPTTKNAIQLIKAANIRSGAGVGYSVIGTAYTGYVYELIEETGYTWAKVRKRYTYNSSTKKYELAETLGQDGYISSTSSGLPLYQKITISV